MRKILLSELHHLATNLENVYFNMTLTKRNIPLFISQYEKAWKQMEVVKAAMDEDLKLVKEGKVPKNILQ
jgi:hypothetical protein